MRLQYIKEIEDKAFEVKEYKSLNITKDNHLVAILLIANSVYKSFLLYDTNEKRLYSLLLKKKFGLNYNKYIQFLLEYDFIKITKKYSANTASTAYSIKNENIKWKWRIFKDSAVTRKDQEYKKDFKKNIDKEYSSNSIIDQHIVEIIMNNISTKNSGWVALAALGGGDSLDGGAYMLHSFYKEFSAHRERNKLTIDKDRIEDFYFEASVYFLNNKMYTESSMLESYYSVFKHSSRCTTDIFANRLHTTITNMSKEMRKHLTIDNKDIVEIDITASQVFFFAATVKEANVENADMFLKDVCSQDFYTLLNNNNNIEDRDEFKSSFFRTILYSCKHSMLKYSKTDEVAKRFKERYESIFKYLLKVKNYDRKDNIKANAALAKRMQRIESTYMRKAWKELLERNIKFTCVIDSIICKKEDLNKVIEVFYSVLSEISEIIQVKIDNIQTTLNKEYISNLYNDTECLKSLLESTETEQLNFWYTEEEITQQKRRNEFIPKYENLYKHKMVEWDDSWLL
jgi:hypothetical protein